MHIRFCRGSLKDKYHLLDLDVDKRKILKWIFKTKGRKMLTGFIWLRMSANSRLL
jgi:hypothetical protein